MLTDKQLREFRLRSMRVPGGCIFWIGSYAPSNYGIFMFHGVRSFAHRVSLEMKLGRKLKQGMLALHTCNNKPCVNPNHLYEGNASQNAIDTWKDGLNPRYKIGPDQRRKLLKEVEDGASIPKTCAKYGVNRNWVSDHRRLVRLGRRKPNL